MVVLLFELLNLRIVADFAAGEHQFEKVAQLFAHVNLVKGERSELSELASNLM